MLGRPQLSFTGIICLLVAVLFSFPAALQAEDGAPWNVVVATNATVAHGGATASALASGSEVVPGDRLTTGAGGAVVLARGEDLITMAENSQVAIVDPQPSGATLLEQPFGQAEYHVTKQPNPHFEVDTPLLATIVKGTTFDVSATAEGSSVAVKEGRVQARDRRGGGSGLVGKGEVGTVTTGSPGVEISLGTLQKATSIMLENPAAMVGSAESEAATSASGSADSNSDSPSGAVSGAAGAVSNAVGNVGTAVGNVVGGVAAAVNGTVSAVGNAVNGTVSGVTNTVGNTVNGVGKTVNNALGNTTGGSGASSGGSSSGGSSSGGSSSGGSSSGGSSSGGSSSGGASSGGSSSGGSSSGGTGTGGTGTSDSGSSGSGTGSGSGSGGGSLGDKVGGALHDIADHLGGLL